jgi:imidazole glycerol-phosphate synthase subunit HisH
MIGIIETGAGNLLSLQHAIKRIGFTPTMVTNLKQLNQCDSVIIPGQGRFGPVMQRLNQNGLASGLSQMVELNRRVIGICVGMQIMFDGSDENLGVKGLQLLKGRVAKLKAPKTPLIGWLPVDVVNASTASVRIPSGDAYFVNSYVVYSDQCNKQTQAAISQYAKPFISAVALNNSIGMQFHPEKSGDYGMEVLKSCLKR